MEADFGSKRGNFGPERGDFRSERVDLGRIGPISGLKEPDLGLSGLGGGGMYGRTYGRKEIHPCVLQDIGPLGPLPKKAGYTATPVGCGWIGAVTEVTRLFGQEQ